MGHEEIVDIFLDHYKTGNFFFFLGGGGGGKGVISVHLRATK